MQKAYYILLIAVQQYLYAQIILVRINILKQGANMVWVLVFWLNFPENFAVHQEFRSERECRDRAQVWNRRFAIVKSDLVAECRPRG